MSPISIKSCHTELPFAAKILITVDVPETDIEDNYDVC